MKILGTTLQLYFPAFPNILSLRAPQRFFVVQKIRSKYLFGGGDLYRIVACSCFLFKFLSNKKPHKSGLPHKSLWTKSFSEILKSEVEVEKRSRNRNRSRLKTEVEVEIEVENRSRNRNRSRQKKEVEVEIEVRNRSRSPHQSHFWGPLLMYHFLVRPTTVRKYDDQKKFPWKKSSVFYWGKNDLNKKEKSCFGALFCAAFCLKTIWTKKQERATIRYRWPPPTKIYEEFSEAGRISTATSRNDTIGGESCAIHMLENSRSSIGAGQSSKLFEQYKHFILLWAPCHRSKICHFFSDVLNRNFLTQTFKT